MVLLEQIVNSNYIQYDRLVSMVSNAFMNSKSDNLNIFIDLYSVLKPLYKNDQYKIENYSAVTSCIINMVSHYRAFFRTRYRVETDIYLVWSSNTPYINKQFYMDYNSKNEYNFNVLKEKREMIDNCLKLVEILCPYLPNVYYINTSFESGVVIYDLMLRSEDKDPTIPHVVITKDKYLYQLPAINKQCVIFRPYKRNKVDYSYFINYDNILHTYLVERKVKDNLNKIVSPELFSVLLALTSLPERNIKSLININQAIKIINNIVEYGRILNGYNSDIDNLYNIIESNLSTKNKINQNIFINRFKAIDIPFQHSVFYNSSERFSLPEKLVDLYDPEGVKYINNKYFDGIPLDLNRL